MRVQIVNTTMRNTYQMYCIEYLHLTHCTRARVGDVAVVHGGRQRAKAARVRRSVADRVQDLHVADVVDVQRLFQAYYQPLEST